MISCSIFKLVTESADLMLGRVVHMGTCWNFPVGHIMSLLVTSYPCYLLEHSVSLCCFYISCMYNILDDK